MTRDELPKARVARQLTLEKPMTVPLFPLPNVVLFPNAVLPLHIFEERYKAMTQDVLDGDRVLALALLRDGWEKNYYSRPPIEPVICVGRIASAEKLADGRYNYLLQGLQRARVLDEHLSNDRNDGSAYRIAVAEPIENVVGDSTIYAEGRAMLQQVISDSSLSQTPLGVKFLELLRAGTATSDMVDLIAFHSIDDLRTKQRLLSEPNVLTRLNDLLPALRSATTRKVSDAMRMAMNPGLN